MSATRRWVLVGLGGIVATPPTATGLRAAPVETIEMRGTERGGRVWFSPRGLAVAPGTTIRFVNRDPGNSHTSTAYHPAILDRMRRIPMAAEPWDSDFLLPDERFDATFTAPGVYDFYCQPHEMAGMAGRIVVGRSDDPGWEGPSDDTADLPPEALAALPSVDDILAQGRIVLEEIK